MNLIPDWRRVLRKAWSVRLLVLAAVLSGLEVAVPLFATDIPRGMFAILSFLITCAAFAARLVAQRSMSDADTAD